MKLDIQKLALSPKELDAQSVVVIEKWLDVNSEECKEKDPEYKISKYLLNRGIQEGFLKVDNQGRIWVHGLHEEFFPYHFELGDKLYGLRIAAAAAN